MMQYSMLFVQGVQSTQFLHELSFSQVSQNEKLVRTKIHLDSSSFCLYILNYLLMSQLIFQRLTSYLEQGRQPPDVMELYLLTHALCFASILDTSVSSPSGVQSLDLHNPSKCHQEQQVKNLQGKSS